MNGWPQLEAETLAELIQATRILGEKMANRRKEHRLFYRGQSNATWELSSTLERRHGPNFRVSRYLNDIRNMKRTLKALSGKSFEIGEEVVPSSVAPTGLFSEREYLIYLRHIGFPSPLLDWTASPYVAAYFAYASLPVGQAEPIAIFVANQLTPRAWMRGEPHVAIWSPDVVAHQRHHLQHACYSVSYQELSDDHWNFTTYEGSASFAAARVLMPASARRRILDELDLMNINAFSLFASEEGLAHALAERHLGRN